MEKHTLAELLAQHARCHTQHICTGLVYNVETMSFITVLLLTTNSIAVGVFDHPRPLPRENFSDVYPVRFYIASVLLFENSTCFFVAESPTPVTVTCEFCAALGEVACQIPRAQCCCLLFLIFPFVLRHELPLGAPVLPAEFFHCFAVFLDFIRNKLSKSLLAAVKFPPSPSIALSNDKA